MCVGSCAVARACQTVKAAMEFDFSHPKGPAKGRAVKARAAKSRALSATCELGQCYGTSRAMSMMACMSAAVWRDSAVC